MYKDTKNQSWHMRPINKWILYWFNNNAWEEVNRYDSYSDCIGKDYPEDTAYAHGPHDGTYFVFVNRLYKLVWCK